MGERNHRVTGDVMAHDARAVANRLIRLSHSNGKTLTHLQVQKLVYFCHAWMLAIFDKPMINQPVEAWQFGPAIGELQESLRQYGKNPVREIPVKRQKEYTNEEERIIRDVFDKYGGLSGYQLSMMAHQEGSPWETTVLTIGEKERISNELIKDYHRKIYERYRNKSKSGAAPE